MFLRSAAPSFHRPTAALLVSCLLGAAVACETARMPVPARLLSSAPEASCSGRQGFTFNEDFECGPYRILDVDRSWTTTVSWDELWFESSRAREHYELTLDGGSDLWDAQLAVGADVDLLELEGFLGGGFSIRFLDERFLVGALQARGASEPWRLAIGRSSDERTMTGALVGAGVEILVEGTNRLVGTSIPSSEVTGYLFLLDGEQVAAVEVINAGAIWISPGLSSELRGALATASAALLLHRSLVHG